MIQKDISSTWEISLPSLFMCLWTFITSNIYFMFLYIFFTCFFLFILYFFSICYGPNVSNLKEMFCLLESIAFFFCLLFIPTCHFLFFVFHIQDYWIRTTCNIQTSTPFQSTHTQNTHTFSSSDACAWNFLHCFLLPCILFST